MARKDTKVTKESIIQRIRFIESQLSHLRLDVGEYFAEEEARVAHQRIVATTTRGDQNNGEEIGINDEVIVTNPSPGQEAEGTVVGYNPDSGYASVQGKHRKQIIKRFLKNLRKR